MAWYNPCMHEAADFPRRLRLALAQPEYAHDTESQPAVSDRLRGVTRRTGQFDYDDPELNQPRPRQPDDHLGGL